MVSYYKNVYIAPLLCHSPLMYLCRCGGQLSSSASQQNIHFLHQVGTPGRLLSDPPPEIQGTPENILWWGFTFWHSQITGDDGHSRLRPLPVCHCSVTSRSHNTNAAVLCWIPHLCTLTGEEGEREREGERVGGTFCLVLLLCVCVP